jgi:hypothetical protein
MKFILAIVISVGLLPAAFNREARLAQNPIMIRGTVTDLRTGKSIAGALVYTVLGEEETLTDRNGRFCLRTLGSLPLEIRIHRGNTEKTIRVESFEKELGVRMDVR